MTMPSHVTTHPHKSLISSPHSSLSHSFCRHGATLGLRPPPCPLLPLLLCIQPLLLQQQQQWEWREMLPLSTVSRGLLLSTVSRGLPLCTVSRGPLYCQHELQDCLPLPASQELDQWYVHVIMSLVWFPLYLFPVGFIHLCFLDHLLVYATLLLCAFSCSLVHEKSCDLIV